MKFSEMPYTRPNLEEIKREAEAVLQRIQNASSAQEQVDAYLAYEQSGKEIATNCSLAYVRQIGRAHV